MSMLEAIARELISSTIEVKKAETLECLEELEISAKTIKLLNDRFNSLDEIIWHGRYMSYIYASYPKITQRNDKSAIELINALDSAGYIRHDISAKSFCINRLYRKVFEDVIDTDEAPDDFYNLCIDEKNVYNYRMGNEKYEKYINPTDGQISIVKNSLQNDLAKTEYMVLAYEMGFEDGFTHNLQEISEHINATRRVVRQVETKALRKLRNKNSLPAIVTSDKQKAAISAIIRELENLRKDPIFEREANLLQELLRFSKLPFTCSKKATEYLKTNLFNNPLDLFDISQLG